MTDAPKRKPGRKVKHDWDLLFEEWSKSGQPKAPWLRERGINPSSGSAFERIKHWDQRLMAAAAGLRETAFIVQGGKVEVPTETGSVSVQETGSREATDVPATAAPAQWQVVDGWRRKQAVEDYRTADTARQAIKMILKDSIKKTVDEEGKPVYRTTLKPHEVRQLTQAMGDVQRVQRLALGLSTENVGLPSITPPDSHVEKNVTPATSEEAPLPTFVVEMSVGGRFLRPRPRRIS